MEKLQGPIAPFLLEELDVGCLEEENGTLGMGISYGQFMSNFEDPYSTEDGDDPQFMLPSLEDKRPFLQMLQGFEPNQPPPSPFFPFMQEPNFQLLLKLQHQKLMMKPFTDPNQSVISCLTSTELESCVTNNNYEGIMDLHSPVKSQAGSEEKEIKVSTTMATENFGPKNRSKNQLGKLSCCPPTKEKRKRKRSTRPSKNMEEVESQRMTHIAVERNRRRQMNEHLNALRSLMPTSYVQRGDQASIIGGAIDFVKELEQLLHSLQAQKRMKQCEDKCGDISAANSSSTTSSSSNLLINNLFMSPSSSSSSPLQFRHPESHSPDGNNNGIPVGGGTTSNNNNINNNEELCAENKSDLADIEVVIIQNHVNLKIQCHRKPGQLLKAIVALEQLRLSVLHLNITSFHAFVYYSFNLKIEEDCKLGSADEVATAVHQIFRFINIT